MKFLWCIFLFLGLNNFVLASSYIIEDEVFSKNLWSKPLNSELKTSKAYDYDSFTYYQNFGFRHGAVDIHAKLNESVYAIDDGDVVDIYKDNSSQNKNMSIIYIKHKSATGKEFLGIYGHAYAKNGLSIGSSVEKGEEIGIIKRFNYPVHLHFGIGLDVNCHPSPRTGGTFGGIKCGIVNPTEFLSKNKNNAQLEVYSFWQSNSNLTYPASCVEGEDILDAQFSIKNISNDYVYVEKLVLSVHDVNNNNLFDARVDTHNQYIHGNGSLIFEPEGIYMVETGTYYLVAKAKYNDQWHELKSQPFYVVSNNSCSAQESVSDSHNETDWGYVANYIFDKFEQELLKEGMSANKLVTNSYNDSFYYVREFRYNGSLFARLTVSKNDRFTMTSPFMEKDLSASAKELYKELYVND